MKTKLLHCLVLGLSSTMVSCSIKPNVDSTTTGYVDNEKVQWPNPSDIPVCWELPPKDPTAKLTNLPSKSSNVTRLNIAVRGEYPDYFDPLDRDQPLPSDPYKDFESFYVTKFKYKLGQGQAVDCSDPAGYRAGQPITQNIRDNISSLPDGNIKLCVLGINDHGDVQSKATEYTWKKSPSSNEAETYNSTSNLTVDYVLSNAENRKALEKRLTGEYKRAGITFTGFDWCSKGSDGIHVVVNYFGLNKVNGVFGAQLDGLINGLFLGFEKPPSGSQPATGGKLYTHHYAVALHEFGHGIGLHHEMNRRDQYGCHADQFEGQGEPRTTPLGSFDKDSVMNYCAIYIKVGDNIPMTLSDNDIASIKEFYNKVPVRDREVYSVAILEGVPERWWKAPRNARLSIKVGSAPFYKYKIGLDRLTDCSDSGGYSEARPSGVPITDDVSSYGAKKDIRVCVVGGTEPEGGIWQSYANASQEIFQIKR